MEPVRNIEEMTLDGGIACLDFANSGYDSGEMPVERLLVYKDVLTLAHRLNLLPESDLRKLAHHAEGHPSAARNALKKITHVRDLIFTIFESVARQTTGDLEAGILDEFNHWLSVALAKKDFQFTDGILRSNWNIAEPDLLHPLWAFLLSCHELLVDRDQHLIRQCRGCRWIFLDNSKSHRRKWCSMQDCGSRLKARRYYEKKKRSIIARNKRSKQ